MCRDFLVFLLVFCVASASDFNICPTREITVSDGMIISPNYPQKYPPNTDCSLTIKQPLNRRIYFTFPYMNLTDGRYNSGCHDYVQIYLGIETSRKLCAFGYDHTSDFNIATVTFKSNGLIERSGFKIKFTSIKEKIYDSSQRKYITGLPAPISVCPSRTVQADLVGRISSPGFPVPNQGVKLNCTLILKKPVAMKLVLRKEIVMLKYNWQTPCPETLTCRAWGYYSRICGTFPYRSDKLNSFEYGELEINFQSDGIDPGRGFLMTYFLADRLERYACVDTGSNRSPSVYLEKKISMTDVLDFKRSNDDITMRFDTSSSTGLVLQVEGGPNEYIILTVEDGKIVFKIKYGTANLTVTEDAHRIDDGRWHDVLVQRRGLNFSIQINRNSPVTGHFPGTLNQLAQYSRRNAVAIMYVFGAPSVRRGFGAYVKIMKINKVIQPVASYFFGDTSFKLMGSSWKWKKEDYCQIW